MKKAASEELDITQTAHASQANLPNGLLPAKDTAARLGLTPHTLACWRVDGKHAKELPPIFIGERVYYRQNDLENFVRLAASGALRKQRARPICAAATA